MAKRSDHYHTKPAPKGDLLTLATLSHDLRVPIARLLGLWKTRSITPVEVGADGLRFDKAQVAALIRFSGDW